MEDFMGLGGHLTWTATAREIYKKYNKKVFACERGKLINSIIFANNKNFSDSPVNSIAVDLSRKETNYCLSDSPDKAVLRTDKHIIEIQCEYYGISNPDLKCDLFFTNEEVDNINNLCKTLPKRFLTIEPNSKSTYTVNRQYPFKKWQNVVRVLLKDIEIVQTGCKDSPLLDGVIDVRGKTSFREACLLIGKSDLFVSIEGGLVHGATATKTQSLVIIGGYASHKLIKYPDNFYIDISSHGHCGMKKMCELCKKDAETHDENSIIKYIYEILSRRNG